MTDHNSARFELAMQRLEAIHAQDPCLEAVDDGSAVPRELLYAQRMCAWLARLNDRPSEALRLAVYAQHLRRWALPRTQYPAGRGGYHAWRREQARRQAAEAARVLAEAGYAPALCARVACLIRKEDLRTDAEAQALEDTACLVFLQHYLPAFAAGRSEEQLTDIFRKTWNKMSSRAQQLAQTLTFPSAQRQLVEVALASA